MKYGSDRNWLLGQIIFWFRILIFSSFIHAGGVGADTHQSFSSPVLIPIRTLVDFNYSLPEPNYQVRFVQWVNATTLKVTASPQGNRSPNDIDLFVDVNQFSGEHSGAGGVEHVVVLSPDYEESECFDLFSDKNLFPDFAQNNIVFDGIFFSDPFGDDSCMFLPAMPEGIRPADQQTDQVLYDGATHSINLIRSGESEHYQLSSDFPLSLAKDRTGILGFSADKTQFSIAVLEVKNSFWAVLLLDPNKSARLIIGPEETSANTGFIPRTLSVAPDGKRWMAYVGPEAGGGRWGISVWDFGSQAGEVRHVGRVGSGIVAYSEHRGFDHPVIWTGRDSILFLEDDELTLSHIRLTENGEINQIGRYSFERGQRFGAAGELLGESWINEFELFRLEAVSVIPVMEHDMLRVALVAVVQYFDIKNNVTKQTALPLVVDIPWNLRNSN